LVINEIEIKKLSDDECVFEIHYNGRKKRKYILNEYIKNFLFYYHYYNIKD
jgi:hypothetical protein